MHMLLSIGTAIAAGLCMAVAGVLQQRRASTRPRRERMSWRLIVSLVRDRIWLLGIGCAVASYGFQAIALATGPLILVQPLIVSELLFALPASVRLRGLRLGRREWLAGTAIVAGLAIGIVAADPRRGTALPPTMRWVPALAVIGAITGACLVIAWRVRPPLKASFLAGAGACMMGLQSGIFSSTIASLRDAGWATFGSWLPYCLIGVSLAGFFLIQNAFQAGPVAASVPVLDAVLPIISIGIGIAVFHDTVRAGPVGLAGAVVGIVLLIVGIVRLDTSPVVRREQRIEDDAKTEHAESV